MPRFRSKIMLEYIENRRARRTCFRKRKEGLIKKMTELSILCDVDCFIVIFSADGEEPLAWPGAEKVHQLMQRYNGIPQIQRNRKMTNQKAFLQEQTRKLEEQVVKLEKKNAIKEMTNPMNQIYYEGKDLSEFDVSELIKLVSFTEEQAKEYRKRVNSFSFNLAPAPPLVPLASEELWFLDLLREANLGNGGNGGNSESDKVLPPNQYHLDLLKEANLGSGGNGGNSESDKVLPPKQYPLDLLREANLGNGGNSESDKVLPPNQYPNDNIDVNYMLMAQSNFGPRNGENNLGFLYGSSSDAIGGNQVGLLPYGNLGGPNGGYEMNLPYENFGLALTYENIGGNIVNNMGLGPYQGNLGGSIGGIDLGSSDGILAITAGNGENLALPHHRNLASGSDQGTSIGVPLGSFGGSSLSLYGGLHDIFKN